MLNRDTAIGSLGSRILPANVTVTDNQVTALPRWAAAKLTFRPNGQATAAPDDSTLFFGPPVESGLTLRPASTDERVAYAAASTLS